MYAPREAVATSQPLASAAGLEILLGGGNAVDAAVAAAAVLNVVEPHMTGIGGDMFAILWSAKDQKLSGLDASGRAGSLITPEVLRADGHEHMPDDGPASVTVPGAVSGWVALLDQHGTMSLAEVLDPAIRIAEEGFPVTPVIARQWRDQSVKLSHNVGAIATYLLEGRRGPETGEWFQNPDLARSFRILANDGPEAFYGGELGQTIVSGLAELGGYLTLDDLVRHRAEWVDPISIDFRDYTIGELPPAFVSVPAVYDERYSVKVYPNPFSSTATFEIGGLTDLQTVNFELFNVLGERVMTSLNISNSTFTVDGSKLGSGIYIYSITSSDAMLSTGKLMVK